MKYYARRKEMIKNGLYILIGAVGIGWITHHLKIIQLEDKDLVVDQVLEAPVISVSEQEISLNIDEIIKNAAKPLSKESIAHIVMNNLPGGDYFDYVKIKQEPVQKVEITYSTKQYEEMLSKARKDQMSLIDASIVMGLYPEVDVIEVNILEKVGKYSKILYRPDLEDYFGIEMDTKDDKNTFERMAKEFLDAEHVSAYWNRKHPYDSYLGEEVEAFYKTNFPVIQDKEQIFPYINEALEESLVEKYGYKLFLQGLKYDNALMNYYCAYRLVEYYDSIYKEEIMLELANCQVHSQDLRVQNACRSVIDFLTNLQENEVRVLDRYKETTLGGGEKLFALNERGLRVLAKWEGKVQAGIDIVSISPRNNYLLCMAVTSERNYIYLLPIQSNDEIQTFVLQEDGVYVLENSERVKKGDELINLMNSSIKKSEEEIENSLFDWYYAAFVKILVGEEKYIYDGVTNQLRTYEQFNNNFDRNDLQTYLDERFRYAVKKSSFYYPTKAETHCIYIGEEKIVVREYSYAGLKNVELNEQKGEEEVLKGRRWERGKLVVNYSGNNQEIIRALDEIMKKD